jgi:hypothetical protein
MPISPTDVLKITIAIGGKFVINGEVMENVEDLTQQLTEAAGWNPQPALHVFPLPADSEEESGYFFVGKVIYTAFRAGFIDPHILFHHEDGTISDSRSQQAG